MPARKIRKMPKVGQTFEKRYKGKIYRLVVTKASDGIAYKLGENILHSPSAAAKSLTNNEVNGWKFWNIIDA